MSGNQVIRGSEKGGNGVREYRSKGVKENYTDTPIPRYTDTPIHRYPDTPIPRFPDTPISHKGGFTLLELMVVVVIIAITIGGALFYGQGTYRRTSVKNAARDVASLMRMASSKALSERIYYNVVFNRSTGNCYLEKHYSGGGGIWEDISITTAKEYSDNTFATDSSPGAKKKLASVVDIDNINTNTSSVQRIAFTLKETVMGFTTGDFPSATNTFSSYDVYSVYLDDNKSGTGNVQYLVTVDSDTARVKIYSSW